MSPKMPFDINAAFRQTSSEMLSRFETARQVTNHGPTLGDDTEVGWRSVLGDFLPSRYAVSSAFVVDHLGNQSDQIDIVIHDRHYSPTFWRMGDKIFIPAECVFAVFEVKPELNKENVVYAGAKAASVRALERTSGVIPQLAPGGTRRPEPKRILAGLLTTTSGWTPGIGESLVHALADRDELERLDIGCALDAGMFELGDGATSTDLQRSDSEVGLAMFAMRLVARLNAIGTISALDYDTYTAPLTSSAIVETRQES